MRGGAREHGLHAAGNARRRLNRAARRAAARLLVRGAAVRHVDRTLVHWLGRDALVLLLMARGQDGVSAVAGLEGKPAEATSLPRQQPDGTRRRRRPWTDG